MRIQVAIPEQNVSADILNAALEPVTRLDEQLIKEQRAPTFDRALKMGLVRWQPEPPGGERFDHAETVLARRWGDCDDLAPWHAASLRSTGEDPGARAIAVRSGDKRWHAIVQRSNGVIDDPSKRAGMNSHNVGAGPPTCPKMVEVQHCIVGAGNIGAFVYRPAIGLRPVYDAGFQARVDIPWFHDKGGKPTPTDVAMATLHAAPLAATALTGAIDGACRLGVLGGYAHQAHINRLCAIGDCVEGASFGALERRYGREHAEAAQAFVSGFFDDLGNVVKSVVHSLPSPIRDVVSSVSDVVNKAYNTVVPALASAAPLLATAAPFLSSVPLVGPGLTASALALAALGPALNKLRTSGASPEALAGIAQAALSQVPGGVAADQLLKYAPQFKPIVTAAQQMASAAKPLASHIQQGQALLHQLVTTTPTLAKIAQTHAPHVMTLKPAAPPKPAPPKKVIAVHVAPPGVRPAMPAPAPPAATAAAAPHPFIQTPAGATRMVIPGTSFSIPIAFG